MRTGANSFLFTDDFSGVVYLVRKKDSSAQVNLEQNKSEELLTLPANSEENEAKNQVCFPAVAILFALSALTVKPLSVR